MRRSTLAATVLAGTLTLTAYASAATRGTRPSPRDPLPTVASAVDTPSSSAVLSLLPEGEAKRRFILDCAGCHQIDVPFAFPNGRARTASEWEQAARRMLAMAGARSGFPIISAEHDPASTARWLAEHLTEPPELAASATPAQVTIREYSYPYPGDLPHDLMVDADGQVVITGMLTHRMLRLDPATGQYEEFAIPVPNANPRALELDADGNWWVLLGAPNAIARYNPATTTWDHWSIGVYGHSVRVDANRIWFNGHFTAQPPTLGYLDPATGAIERFEVPLTPAPDAQNPVPYGLRVGPEGAVYVTELAGNRLVRLDPASGDIRVWKLPTSHSGPRRPAVASDGTVWIPLYAANAIASFDPDAGTFTEFPLPTADALPYIVLVDTRGRVVVGTAAADAVFRFDPANETWDVFPLPSRGVLIRHMDLERDTGDLWVAYAASPGIPAMIARLSLGQ